MTRGLALPLTQASRTFLVSYVVSRTCAFAVQFVLLGPQYKRISALQGDFVFHGPRRLLLNYRASKQASWAFRTYLNFKILSCERLIVGRLAVFKRGKNVPFIGSVILTLSPKLLTAAHFSFYFIFYSPSLGSRDGSHGLHRGH